MQTTNTVSEQQNIMNMEQLRTLNAIAIGVFSIFGVFGNTQLVWATLRKKELLTKSGYLLALQAFIHIFCLMGEWVNMIFVIRAQPFDRNTCFLSIAWYIVLVNMQCFVTLAMSFDLLFMLLLPVRYTTTKAIPYFLALFTAPLMVCGGIEVLGFRTRDTEELLFCNPPMALVEDVRGIWSAISNLTNFITVLLYVVVMFLVHFRGSQSGQTQQRRVLRRVTVICVFFVCSYFTAQIMVMLPNFIKMDPITTICVQSGAIFPVLLCYTQNYFICLWRSSEYRHSFKEQFYVLTCRPHKKVNNASHARASAFNNNTVRSTYTGADNAN